jgi:DeoR family transcriptional regulator, aga operon transcriptional repressor
MLGRERMLFADDRSGEHAFMDRQQRVRQAERLSAILERLSGNGSVSVTDIADDLRVSSATIRRDLHLLETQRLLARTHGGAVAQGMLYELPLRYKAARNQSEKLRIARAAADRVADGSAIGLTGGTTTTEVARSLVDRQRLTVVTNALNIASELVVRPKIKLVVTGGVARQESYELVGPIAETSLAGFHLDVVFVGADGIGLDAGLTTHHEVEAHTNRALIDRAARVIVVADSSKLGRVAFARICEIDRVHELITDTRADASAVAAFREVGVEVLTV